MEKIKVLDFCDKNKIPYILIKKTIQKGRKHVEGILPKWNDKSYDYLMEHYNNKRLKMVSYNTIMINVRAGGYVVADCDDEHVKKYFYEKYGKAWKTKSCSKNLPHIWFKRHNNDNNGTKVNISKGIDLVYEFVFERIDMKFLNTKEDMKTFQDFQEVVEETKKKPIKRKKN